MDTKKELTNLEMIDLGLVRHMEEEGGEMSSLEIRNRHYKTIDIETVQNRMDILVRKGWFEIIDQDGYISIYALTPEARKELNKC